MSEDESAWTLGNCPVCDSPLRVPGVGEVTRIQCPGCGEVLVPDGEPTELPVNRNVQPESFPMRGREREDWQHTGRDLLADGPRLNAPIARIGSDDVERVEHVRVRRRRKSRPEDAPEWEADGDAAKPVIESDSRAARRARQRRKAILIAFATAMGVGLIVMVWFMVRQITAPVGSDAPIVPPAVAKAAEASATAARNADSSAQRAFPVVQDDDYALVRKAIDRFFSVKTISELSTAVRDPGRVRQQMEAHHGSKPIDFGKLRSIPERGELLAYRNVVVAVIETDDLERHVMALEKIDGEFKVDWESFVGWCEVPWDKIRAARPTEPVIMRVHIEGGDRSNAYYNYDFSDPEGWA